MSTIRLGILAKVVADATLVGGSSADVVLSGIAYDSRQVRPGYLFLAMPGERFDGHDYIPAALESGAAAIVLQADKASRFPDLPVPCMVVPSVRAALAPIACRFYADPTHALHLTGVTGTNGKTTTTRMIEAITKAAGERTGVIGTLGATIDGDSVPGDRTTPEAPDLQALFARMRDAGVTSAAMEVASHALAQGRTDGCAFDIGIFTNLTQDHLDYHKTMEGYRDAKLRLFTDYVETARVAGKNFIAILNADDEAGEWYAARTSATTLRYSPSGAKVDISATDISPAIDGIRFTACTPAGDIPIELGFGGLFNVANALAAIGYAIARSFSPETITRGLANCAPVPGRFQPVRAGQDFALLVDYAHTPDGLENVLTSARPLTSGRLIVVFGCGGDRDRTKRPRMGNLALRLADIAVVTSDNPRTENPEAIIDEILEGMKGDGARVLRESDRRRAIALAVSEARAGDTVVIAGKGHETYQIVGDTVLPFDDVQVASEEVARCAR